MIGFFEMVNGFSAEIFPIIMTVLVVVAAYVIFRVFAGVTKRNLLKLAKTKKQISNVEMLFSVIKYIFVFFLLLAAMFYYAGSWEGLGLTLGLFSAAIGFALQKPISGIAAWMMVVTRRPFEIGDRVVIGSVSGDVKDVSLTHVSLKEIGGTIPSEENSGRIILVPNSLLFEQNVVNYTQQGDYVLDQISYTITYGSDLDKAIKISIEAAKEVSERLGGHPKTEPFVRSYFQASGMDLYVRFFVPAKRRQEFTSELSREIFHQVRKDKSVEFAFPHTQVLLDKGSKQT